MLAAVVLLAFIALIARLQSGEPRLLAIEDPERALALVVGRTMDVETALAAAPGWERRLYGLTLSEPARQFNEAIAWYEELTEYSLAPGVDLRLAILRAEGGRTEQLAGMLEEWQTRGEPLATAAGVLAAAYLGVGDVDADAVQHALRVLGPGWFADVLALRLAAAFAEPALAEQARASMAARAGALLRRLRVLALADVVLLVAGVLAIVTLRRRPPEARLVAAAALPPPWSMGAGLAVIVRGGAVSALLLVSLLAAAPWLAERPVFAEALDVPIMYLPIAVLAWRLLLVPAGTTFGAAFGLRTVPGGGRPLVLAIAGLLAAGIVFDVGLAVGGGWLDLDTHWAEWFDSDLAWGPAVAVAVTLITTVVLAPVFEELIFRGLLYGSLRTRLGVAPALLLSAAVFALAHGYSPVGFASVFLSGALWAWSYERTGSLLPAIGAHVANNAAVSATLLWLLR